MIARKPDESDDEFFERIAREDGVVEKPGIEIIILLDPGPDDLVLANIRLAADGSVVAWQLMGENRDDVTFKMNPVPAWDELGMFAAVELLAKCCRTVNEGGTPTS